MSAHTIHYSILDPTGNITALVETDIPAHLQPQIALQIMQRHPAVEQVGFVQYYAAGPLDGSLRMAGGEFCGNASMCAAALSLIRAGSKKTGRDAHEIPVLLSVSGAEKPVEVRLMPETDLPDGAKLSFRSSIHMPPAIRILDQEFSFAGQSGSLSLVFMEGISHLIIEPSSVFFPLKNSPAQAGLAVKSWCEQTKADGLGLMFLEETDETAVASDRTGLSCAFKLTPLVYVPGSGTSFWENSCASGSTAAGMFLAARAARPVRVQLDEPGGSLTVTSDPHRNETWLYGHVLWQEDCRISL